MLVSGVGELLGDLVPLVQPLDWFHPYPFTELRLEGCIDDVGILVHELLSCGTTTGFGIGLFVDALEDRSPHVGFGGVAGGGAVTKPLGDPLWGVA